VTRDPYIDRGLTSVLMSIRDGRLRLLPWTSPEGKPCFLSTDGGGSRLSLLADEMEEAQFANGVEVLGGARAVLADQHAGALELRFTASRLAECLLDLLRIAESRGRRLPEPDVPGPDVPGPDVPGPDVPGDEPGDEPRGGIS
jgi:hypothetical protein